MVSFRVGGQFSSGAVVLEPQKLNGKIKDGDFFRGDSFLGVFFPGEFFLEGNFPWGGGVPGEFFWGDFFLELYMPYLLALLITKRFFGAW